MRRTRLQQLQGITPAFLMLHRNALKIARTSHRHISEVLRSGSANKLLAVRAFSSIICDTISFQGYTNIEESAFFPSSRFYLHSINRGFSTDGELDGQPADESAGNIQDALPSSIAGERSQNAWSCGNFVRGNQKRLCQDG